jgi:hypothetical protein
MKGALMVNRCYICGEYYIVEEGHRCKNDNDWENLL